MINLGIIGVGGRGKVSLLVDDIDYYFKDWHANRALSNSLLVHKGVHDIDAIHWLSNSYSDIVQGMGSLSVYNQIDDRREIEKSDDSDYSMDHWPPLSLKKLNPIIDVEDLSLIQMRLKNGIIASYEQCHYTPDYWRNFTVIGTEGRIENFGTRTEGSFIRLYNKKTLYSNSGSIDYPLKAEYQDGDSPDLREMVDFLDFLINKSKNGAFVIDAREAVATADMGTYSIRKGLGSVSIPQIKCTILDYFNAKNS